MSEAEYILRIILRAKDEFAAVFAKARTQIQGLRSDHTALNAVLKTTNDRITSLNTRYGNLIKKTNEARDAMRELAKGTEADFDKLDRQIDRTTGAITKNSRAARAAAKETRDVNLEFDRLVDKTDQLTRAFRANERGREDTIDDLKQISREARAMQKALDVGDSQREIFGDLARGAERAARQIENSHKAHMRAQKERLEGMRREAREAEQAHQDAVNQAQSESEIEQKRLEAKKASADAERERRQQLRQAITDLSRYNSQLGRSNQLTAEQTATIKRYQQDIRKLGRDVDINSSEFKDMSRVLSNTDERLKAANVSVRRIDVDINKTGRSVRVLGREVDKSGGWAQRFDNWAASISYTGDSVAKLDNNLRGMIVLGALVFAQQLGSILIALAGTLLSVASSAAMAGAGLAGMAATGVAQGLPAIGLLIAALSRLKSIMDAVGQSDTVRQQRFQQGQKGDQDAANRADQIANAQDSLRDANDRVADAQRRVTKATEDLADARREGRRELEDLILAERRAELAARGAALSQAEAQDQLRQAIARGETGTEFQRRELAVSEAAVDVRDTRVELGRAREKGAIGRAGDVEQLDSVKNAREQVADARRGLEQAKNAVDRAERSLAQAKRSASEAASGYLASAAALTYMLAQLSESERRLYRSIQRIRDTFKREFRPITDIIIDAFTRGVNTADRLLRRRDVIEAAKGMSTGIAAEIDKVRIAFTRGVRLQQLLRIINQARDNLAPIGTLVTRLGKAFLNIAEAANPAFQKFLGFINRLVLRFLDLTSDKGKLEDFFLAGEAHLESWIKLALAVIHLFAALTGAGGADEGKRSIDDLTKSIDRTADRIERNGDKVRKFFRDARRATDAVLGVLKDLGSEMLRSFNPESVEGFAKFLRTVVVPALGISIRTVGGLVHIVTTLLTLPLVGTMAKYGVAFLLFSKVVTGTSGLIQSMLTQTAHFIKIVGAGPAAVGRFGTMLGGLGTKAKDFQKAMTFTASGRMAEAPKSLQLMQRGLGRVSTMATGASAAMTSFGVATKAALIAAAPWIVLAAAIGVGVALFLKHFGRLDDVLQGAKDAWEEFKRILQPGIDELKEALGGLGITFGKTGNAMKILHDIGQVFADFIAKYLVDSLKLLARIVGNVVVTQLRILANVIKGLRGVFDVIIGLFTLDFDQVGRGLGRIADAFLGIGDAIVDGLVQGFRNMVDMFLLPFKAAWNAVKRFFGISSPSRAGRSLGDAIKDGVAGGIRGLVGVLTAPFRLAWRGIKAVFNGARDFGEWIVKKWIAGIRGEANLAKNAASWVWGRIKDAFDGAKNFGGKIVHWIVDGFKKLPGALGDLVHTLGDALEDIGKRIGRAIIKGVKKIPGVKQAMDAAGWVGDKLPFAQGGVVPGGYGGGDIVSAILEPGEHVLTKEEVRAAGGHSAIFALRALLGGGRQGGPFAFASGGSVESFGTRSQPVAQEKTTRMSINIDADVDDKAHKWRLMWREILDSTRRNSNAVEAQFRDMRVNIERTLSRLRRVFTDRVVDIEMSGKVHLARLGNAWEATFGDVRKATYDGLFYVGHETNKALTGLGEKHIDFHFSRPRGGERRATGGVIGNWGERGMDKVLAWLGRGEVVLNHWQQRALNAMLPGQLTVQNALSQRGFHAGGYDQPGFASGGVAGGIKMVPIVGQQNEEINSKIYKLVMSWIRKYHALITDAFDRDHSAGHRSPGHNVTGTAVDFVPGRGGSWASIEAMGREAVSKGMTVGYDAHIPGAQLWPGHGRGNHIHIEFGSNPKAAVLDAVTRVGRGRVSGAGGLHDVIQAAVDKSRLAANEKIRAMEALDVVSDATSFIDLGKPDSNVIRTIGRAWRAMNLPFKALLSAVETGIVESGLRNLTGGDADSQGWRQERASIYPDPRNVSHSVQRFFREWTQFADPGETAGQIAAQVQRPAAQYRGRYDAVRSQAMSIIRSMGIRGGGDDGFARGGVIRGQAGKAVSAVVHAGEWILNKFQQSRLASMLGLAPDTLRGLLGFHGGGGSFAGGGQAEAEDQDTIPLYTSSAERRRLSRLERGVYEISMMPLETWENIMTEMKRVFHAINQGGKKVRRALGRDLDAIDKLTAEGGLLDTMDAERQERETTRLTQLATATFGRRTSGKGAGRDWTVRRLLSPTQIADRQLSNARRNLSDAIGERGDISESLAIVDRRLARIREDGKVTKDEAKKFARLQGQRSNLKKRLQDISSEVGSGLEEVFNAQAAQAQAAVDAINERFERKRRPTELLGRVADMLGNEGLQDKVSEAMRNSWLAQADALEAQIGRAKASGNTELAKQLSDQVEDFRLQAFESLQQDFQKAIDRINESTQTKLTWLDRMGRMADVQAGFGAGGTGGMDPIGAARNRERLNSMRRTVLTDQRQQLIWAQQAQLSLPAEQRNQTILKGLADQIGELDVALVENTAQQRELTAATREASLNMITSRQQFQGGVQGTLAQIIEAVGQLAGNQVDVGRQIQVATDQGATLGQTRDALRGDLLRDWGIDLMGLSGLNLVDRVRGMNFDQLTAGMDEKSKGVFESLINEILNNELALIGNTKTIQELSGQVAESQTFSTTAWQWFRQAIFNNNEVLPQYRVPSNVADPAMVALSDSRSSSSLRSSAISKEVVREVHQDIDVNYNEVNESPSPEETATRVAWFAKTANTMT